jgi:hypothetical protein
MLDLISDTIDKPPCSIWRSVDCHQSVWSFGRWHLKELEVPLRS